MAEVHYSDSIEIAVPPETIFDYRLDFTTLSEYNPSVSNVRVIGDREYAFDLTLPGSSPVETPLRVTLSERPTRIVFDTGPGYMATEDCSFEPSPNGTHVSFAYTLRFPTDIDDATEGVLVAAGREQVRMELENLKKILEG